LWKNLRIVVPECLRAPDYCCGRVLELRMGL
jgi:hypothetical protein